MCLSKLQTKIIAHACSCIFIKFQNKIYPRPGLEWNIRLMLPSSVMCWQTIDEEMSAYDTT